MPGLVLTYVWLGAVLVGAGGAVPAEGPGPAPEARGSDVIVERATPAVREGQVEPAAPREATEAAVQEPADILERTAAAYEAMTSVAADFTQILQNTLLGRTTESAGTLYQREPDRFLMDFSDPEGDLIVSDGRYFWMYFPSVDANQVIRTPRRGQGLDLKAQFIGDPVERFEYEYHGRETFRGRASHVFTLTPRQPMGYRRMKVWIDGEDWLVRRFEIHEDNGNVRHMELRNVVVNPELPDTLFDFTPPAGAIVVERG